MKQIILCADDYGLNEPVSRGILTLIENQRLSATSCMVNFQDWPIQADWLKPYLSKVDVGLHLNFTEGPALTTAKSFTSADGKFVSLPHLLIKSHLHLLKKSEIKTEILAQIERFQNYMGQLPLFIDGHQHIHHLPQIRDVLLEIYQNELAEKNIAIRNVAQPLCLSPKYSSIKMQIVQYTGALNFAKKLKQKNIPYNKAFAGFYNFDPTANYRLNFQQFLQQMPEQSGMIMCHPGYEAPNDILAKARLNEFTYFNSEQFAVDCKTQQVQLVSFRKLT